MLNNSFRPIFSVITPVYRRKRLVIETIKSVLVQEGISKKLIEIIIVDDDHDVKTLSGNRKFYTSLSPNIIYTRNKFKEGPGGARQTGLKMAKGKYLIFLDSDDCLKKNFIRNMSEVLKCDKNSVAAVSFSNPIFDSGLPIREKIKLIFLMFIRDVLLITSYMTNNKHLFSGAFYLCQFSHMMFKTDVLSDIYFNYDYRMGGEDWDFIATVLTKGDIRIVFRKLLLFRYSRTSMINEPVNRKLKWKSYLLLVRRLPLKYRSGIIYNLFLTYIRIFGK